MKSVLTKSAYRFSPCMHQEWESIDILVRRCVYIIFACFTGATLSLGKMNVRCTFVFFLNSTGGSQMHNVTA